MLITFTLNGSPVSRDLDPARRLVNVLREDFRLTGTKEGCGEGECGACTILMDGEAVHACLVLAGQIEGREIVTIEGLAENGKLSIMQDPRHDHERNGDIAQKSRSDRRGSAHRAFRQHLPLHGV